MIVRWGLDQLPQTIAEVGIENPYVIAGERWRDLALPIHTGWWSEVPSENVPVTLPSRLTVKELAEAMRVQPGEVIKALLNNNLLATINQPIDYDTAAIVAVDLGFVPTEAQAPTMESTALGQAVSDLSPSWVAEYIANRRLTRNRDWNATRYFPLAMDHAGYMRINLAGREPNGIVDPWKR